MTGKPAVNKTRIITQEQRDRWNKAKRSKYKSDPEYRERCRESDRKSKLKAKKEGRNYYKEARRRNPISYWLKQTFTQARVRSTKKNIPFDLNTYKDIESLLVDTCPLLGIKLNYIDARNNDPASPSLDRIDNDKGYTKDNIWIISKRANTLKADSTLKELETLVNNWKDASD